MFDRGLRFFTVVAAFSLCAVAPAAGRPDPWSLLARLHREAAAQALIMHVGRQQGPKPAARPPATFYLNAATGSDANPGTSPQRPWRTLARADLERYRGGDRLLLRAGQRFPGNLRLDPLNLTDTSQRRPLTIGAYGGGRATIAAGRRSGLVARKRRRRPHRQPRRSRPAHRLPCRHLRDLLRRPPGQPHARRRHHGRKRRRARLLRWDHDRLR
jgi:hypothetical protein